MSLICWRNASYSGFGCLLPVVSFHCPLFLVFPVNWAHTVGCHSLQWWTCVNRCCPVWHHMWLRVSTLNSMECCALKAWMRLVSPSCCVWAHRVCSAVFGDTWVWQRAGCALACCLQLYLHPWQSAAEGRDHLQGQETLCVCVFCLSLGQWLLRVTPPGASGPRLTALFALCREECHFVPG